MPSFGRDTEGDPSQTQIKTEMPWKCEDLETKILDPDRFPLPFFSLDISLSLSFFGKPSFHAFRNPKENSHALGTIRFSQFGDTPTSPLPKPRRRGSQLRLPACGKLAHAAARRYVWVLSHKPRVRAMLGWG